MDGSIDFQPYLSSICHNYGEWWKLYTLTDIEGKDTGSSEPNKQTALFDFGLMMQSVNKREPEASQQKKTEKLERRPVLDGLRKSWVEAKHILLVGRPGSGKSTALARLLLEEAQQNQGDTGEKRISVLVELRSYKTSVLDLIQDFFRRHNLNLEIQQVETLLSQNRLLLLVDGLNELPSEAARQDIAKLRNHRRVPMIFTTRDLSLGGDFGIEKQWEMLPLTEPQMKEFIRAHLSPEQADAMWRQLQDRTRKFAETPLLLWMLCELFGQVEEIPHNLGEVFRTFTRTYENSSIRKYEIAALKGDVQSLSDRRLWFPALKHLAYLMMQGETPVDSRTVISREEAEEKLKALFSEETSPSEVARNCLDDLLKYHLLQIKSGNEIEFRYQLFQEYYAAEWLLQRLPNLTDEQLKYYFLNYLKWTEAIALMLGLLDSQLKT
ncbi:MAG: NACHT domain-containing protein, partial [Kovacikia sp.]